jgi:hypothetical protein
MSLGLLLAPGAPAEVSLDPPGDSVSQSAVEVGSEAATRYETDHHSRWTALPRIVILMGS